VYALPLDRPGKIIAIGLNYRDHAKEADVSTPPQPVIFAKFSSSLVASGEPIRIPRSCSQADYEAELAVVIGRTARGVSAADAMDHVLGYTCMNDVTDREAQVSDGQWVRSKSYDTFGPVGPRMVPASDIPDPQNLSVRCWLNGELLQDGHTSDMIFGVAELIAYVSDTVTLDPGDIITTGTPAGVGAFREVPIFLKPGDEVTVEIEGIGRLTNPVIAGR
jgi:2-keto-4-pentenoate hydratase/2-oxohepta-3-ene-1,7-dioic acid hydratase in catechol pathway